MNGTLTKKINGTWVVRVQSTDQHPSPSVVEHGVEYPLHPDDHRDYVLDNNGYFYFYDGKEVEFEVVRYCKYHNSDPSKNSVCTIDCGYDEVSYAKLINPIPDISKIVEDDVEKLAEEESHNHISYGGGAEGWIKSGFRKGYIKGYNKAKETLYTEEQVIEIVEKSRATGLTAEYIMLSLKQPKR